MLVRKQKDSCSPNLCKSQNLQVGHFPSAVLQAGRDDSDTVDEAQAVVDAKVSFTRRTLDPFDRFICV